VRMLKVHEGGGKATASRRRRLPGSRRERRTWTVYLLLCADGTLYCGCTSDLARRLKEHVEGRGARYTRGRDPFEVVALRKSLTRGEALRLEAEVKRRPRSEKAVFLAAGGADRLGTRG
jgi:putative endonuclease